ncbi:MAG: serine acetyltransferase [Nitrospira sp.]
MMLFHRIRSKWGIEISRSAEIGRGFYIGHYGGITISGLARIGRDVNISQLVTIGVSGRGENRGVPIIGDNVYIAPGAKIFGKIRVGNNVKIGANAVVHKDIPDDAVVVLDPGFRIISFRGKRESQG